MKGCVFITGISGFIGYELAEACLNSGFEVCGLVRKSPRVSESLERLRGRVRLYEGNLQDMGGMYSIIRDASPDYIAHLGAITPVSYSFEHPWEVLGTNFFGTVNLVEAVRMVDPGLKLLVYASSMETYGHQPELARDWVPFDEGTSQNAACPYAVSKIASEQYLRYLFYSYGFPCVCLRQTNTYGRRFDDYFVVESFITEMLKNEKVVNFGNPSPVRNFLHIYDLVNLYISLFKQADSKILGGCYTVGPPNGISILELAKKIKKKTGFKGKINWYTREHRPGEIFYLNSTGKCISELTGWASKIGLDEGLDLCVRYWRDRVG